MAWSTTPSFTSRTSVASSTLDLCSALGLGLLSHFEHKRSIRPSFLIAFYLLTTVPFDATRARTQWLLDNQIVAASLTATVAVKLILLIFEDWDKKRFLLSAWNDGAPESRSGIFSRGLFWWLNNLLVEGSKKILSVDDLFPIDGCLSSARILEQLTQTWNKGTNSSGLYQNLLV